MLKLAIVCWMPPARSRIFIGWRMDLIPTLSMAIRRTSGVAWTSGMGSWLRWFKDLPLACNRNYRVAG